MLRRLVSALLLRKVSRDLADISASLRLQTALLGRLADRYAPIDPPTVRAEVQADTGLSFADPLDLQLADAYRERIRRDTGYTPDDDDVLLYLGDERTRDLRERLLAREQELARLRESREW